MRRVPTSLETIFSKITTERQLCAAALALHASVVQKPAVPRIWLPEQKSNTNYIDECILSNIEQVEIDTKILVASFPKLPAHLFCLLILFLL